jgi:hypothetical protein
MADNIKISALTELVSGSITGTTIVPLVDGGVTLKAQMSSLKAFTNSDVATDAELANQIASVNNTISGLGTDDISEGTAQFYTDARVKTKLDTEGVLSGSFPAGFNLGVIGGGTSVSTVDSITVYGADVTDNGSGDIALSINSGSLSISDGVRTASNVNTINVSGGSVTATDGQMTLTLTTDSLNTFTGSIDNRVELLESESINNDNTSLNTFTGSIDGRVDTLELAGNDSDNAQLNLFTGSFSSSVETRITTIEDTPQSVSEDTVSGSQQISDFGFISSSRKFISDTLTITSASITGDVTLEVPVGGGGGEGGDVSFNSNYHIISQSVADGSDTNLELTNIKIGTGLNNFQFIHFSESLNSRFGAGGGSDYIQTVTFGENALTFTGVGSGFNGDVQLSTGIISGSSQLDTLGYLSDSNVTPIYIEAKLPRNLVSGSTQLIELGVPLNENTASLALNVNISGSFTELSASIASDIAELDGVSLSLGEATRSLLEGGSSDALGNVINLVSSSGQIQEAISDAYISASAAGSGFGSGGNVADDIANLYVFTGSIDTRVTTIEGLDIDNASINIFTASFSSSIAGRVSSIDGRVSTLEVDSGGLTEVSYSELSQSYDSFNSNLTLDRVRIGGDSGNYTFREVSQSFDARINGISGVTGLAGLSDVGTITVDVAEGDILVYDSVAQEFTHSQDLTGNYKITGSIDTKGSINVSGSVTADSFIAGDVGTPTISAATTLEIDAGNTIQITTGGGGLILSSSADVRVNHMLTLEKTIGNPSASPLTGSMMNSGSIGTDSKLWFFNGTEWKEIQFVS